MRILLMGNPNVGKSVLFSRLTGVHVITSNYAGTTVHYTQGFMKLGEYQVEVIDVPGTYTLEPTCEAEEVARRIIDSGDIIINVVNATNLERNLYLTLQLLEKKVKLIVALNMWDDTRHQGINIDLDGLRKALGVPVIPTVATTGEGIKTLVENIPKAVSLEIPVRSHEERWAAVGNIIEHIQQVTHRHHTFSERLADASVRSFSGALIAIIVLTAAFIIIRFIGETLIGYVFDPLFEKFWVPVLTGLSVLLEGNGFLHNILVGTLIEGNVDFVQTLVFQRPLCTVRHGPALYHFLLLGSRFSGRYGLSAAFEAVLADTIMHRLGLHGYAIIPTLLGFGCNVPAILSTRILESKRERFIAATLISIAVPCAALQAMIFGLLGSHGWKYVAMVYSTLFVIWIVLGTILRQIVKGFTPELLIEIPPYRLPPWKTTLQKLWMRTYGFLMEAVPMILGAILVVNVLFFLGVFEVIADFTAPVVNGVLGLPKEAVTALIVGFLRKDVAVGMLAPLSLTAEQLVVGCVVLAMFFPCIATFVVLLRELGIINMLKSAAIMITAALITGGLLNFIL